MALVKILADASLPSLPALFEPAFTLTPYHNEEQLHSLLSNHDVLLCRSTLRVNAELLRHRSIQCVATASSGIDHIDSNYLSQKGVHLFDAKGSNARAVADYVVATLGALHQMGKSVGKRAGIIGVGEVGARVASRMLAAGFEVIYFDPPRALKDNNHVYCSLTDLTTCDVLCIHANLHQETLFPSKNLLNANFFAQLKSDVIIINAARGGIINEEDLVAKPWPIIYCTDVYNNEPTINSRIVNFSTLCTPHIAGHSIEAKTAAVVQLSRQLHHYYGFTEPTVEKTSTHHDFISADGKTWQEYVLNLYNPLVETLVLKAAIDKKDVFLTQRKAHQDRHDFNYYSSSGLEQQTKLLLGY